MSTKAPKEKKKKLKTLNLSTSDINACTTIYTEEGSEIYSPSEFCKGRYKETNLVGKLYEFMYGPDLNRKIKVTHLQATRQRY